MDKTLCFYTDVLGFVPVIKSAEYAVMERDGQTIHFQLAANEEVVKCVRGPHSDLHRGVRHPRPLGPSKNLQGSLPNSRPLRPRLRHDRIPHRRPQRLSRLRRRTNLEVGPLFRPPGGGPGQLVVRALEAWRTRILPRRLRRPRATSSRATDSRRIPSMGFGAFGNLVMPPGAAAAFPIL